MNDLTTTVDTCLAAWNEADLPRRADLIKRAWTEDARQIDPPLAAQGHTGISDMISALHGQFPGHRFRRASGVDAHHDFLRYAWELVSPDGAVAVAGLDVGEVAPDGRLHRVTGFFGGLPPTEG